jgi:hypothetical protein
MACLAPSAMLDGSVTVQGGPWRDTELAGEHTPARPVSTTLETDPVQPADRAARLVNVAMNGHARHATEFPGAELVAELRGTPESRSAPTRTVCGRALYRAPFGTVVHPCSSAAWPALLPNSCAAPTSQAGNPCLGWYRGRADSHRRVFSCLWVA